MNQLPEFWRTEIWHPLSVHLPIALLLVAALFGLTAFFTKKEKWYEFSYILLLIGTVGAWVSVYTGNLADGVVGRTLCDPTVFENHENAAYTVAWLFSVASVLAIADYKNVLVKFKSYNRILILVLMLTGSGFLSYAGHLGAELVYQQAAGVYTPSDDCSEFSE
ncbi:MAG: hypothetical protein CMF23_02670 [Ignavibacteriae bacterium]|nr:hypothetical protein [Ignavibacteriota bacterium]